MVSKKPAAALPEETEEDLIGPPSAGVEHINEHGQKHFNGVLKCRWTQNKGRVVHATQAYKQGEIILRESPLHIVQEEESCAGFQQLQDLCKKYPDDFDYEPLWYWCALQSLTATQLKDAKAGGWEGTDEATQHNLMLLHHEDVNKPSRSSQILSDQLVPSADAVLIEQLTQIWVLNCFEYSDAPPGYSTYFFSSFMSHSCYPNAVWHYEDADHVLRARRDISVGDEVCISYLTESGLLQSVPTRRSELHDTKRFWCTCERCAAPVDRSRGFVCTSCRAGIIFSFCPEDASASGDGASPLLPVHLIGAECNKCNFKLNRAGAKKLNTMERELQDIIDRYSGLASNDKSKEIPLKEMQDWETFIEKHFAQHVLADLCWEQMSDIYGLRGRLADQRRLLDLRCKFHLAAYPGLSGAHAWMLEAYGDALMKSGSSSGSNLSASQKEKPSSTNSAGGGSKAPASKKKVWEQAARRDPKASMERFEQSLRILRLMFGERHEYVEQVVEKYEKARAALKECGQLEVA